MDLEFMALDILESIRPRMRIFKSFEEADWACKKIKEKEVLRINTRKGKESDEDEQSDDDEVAKVNSIFKYLF